MKKQIETKRCSKCGKVKSVDGFYTGLRCKDCLRIKRKEYNRENKERLKEKAKKYYAENKQKKKKYDKKYRSENKEKLKNQRREYYEKNKLEISEKRREQRAKNAKKISRYDKRRRKKTVEICGKEFYLKTCEEEIKPTIIELIKVRELKKELLKKRIKIKTLKEA